MRRISAIFLILMISMPADAQEKSRQNTEIQEHYRKFNIEDIRQIERNMDADIPLGLAKTQKLLNQFYREHPANIKYTPDTNLESTLERQLDPAYSANPRLDQVLKKIREKQIPQFIKDAPNIFELHRNMARGLMKAEKNGIIFTHNPVSAAYYYFTALRYRSLKLTPEIWTDPQRLELQADKNETTDANAFTTASRRLETAIKEYDETKKKLFVEEDRAVVNLKDPGNNEPMYSNNRKTLATMQEKINGLKAEMANQFGIYKKYETAYNKESADYLLELADIVLAVDEGIRDREKILNFRQFYENNSNATFQQTWKLESRKSSYISLLETASLLDPENPLTSYRLGKEYYLNGDKLMAIRSFEDSLRKDNGRNTLPPEHVKDSLQLLGGLYYSIKRFVDSAYYYTELLKKDDNDHTRLELARIHTENTGNYEEARKLLVSLASKLPEKKADPVQRAGDLKYQYDIESLLITVFSKTSNREELLKTLNSTHELHLELRELLKKSYDELYESEKILVNSRVEMSQNPGENTMQKFYTDEDSYKRKKETVRSIEQTLKNMNFEKIYFTMAHENEMNHNIQGAIDAYRMAESYGINPDHARREIMRLQKKY